jgi:hypothetical protein
MVSLFAKESRVGTGADPFSAELEDGFSASPEAAVVEEASVLVRPVTSIFVSSI